MFKPKYFHGDDNQDNNNLHKKEKITSEIQIGPGSSQNNNHRGTQESIHANPEFDASYINVT